MAKTEAFHRSTRRYKGATKMHPLLFTCPTIKRALNTFLIAFKEWKNTILT